MRLLIIAYHFPPDAAVGGIRPYQLARRLPEHGIEPWVLTVRPEYPAWIESGEWLDGVPEARMTRRDVGRTQICTLTGA
jgi:hypothetical protein